MKWEMIKMHFYKNKNDNFFLQFDEEVQDSEELLHVLVEKHEGDETKHQPIITKEKQQVKVKVGDVMHPMTQEHHISMIFLKPNKVDNTKCCHI